MHDAMSASVAAVLRLLPSGGSPTSWGRVSGPTWVAIVGLVGFGLLLSLVGSLLTARRRADRTIARATALLRASEERFRSLSSAAPIGIIEVTPTQGVVYANPKMAEISGKELDALMGAGWLNSVHRDDLNDLLAVIESVRESQTQFSMSFRVVHHPDDEVRHVRVMAAPRSAEADGAYVVSIEDVTDEVTSRQELTYRAFHDALTGLPNRALFLDRLNVEIGRHDRSGSRFAVLFLDIDEFKVVNDSLGHESGDEVLKELGLRFQTALRKGETAARFSGDEFAFILSDVASTDDAIAAASRLLALLEPKISVADHELSVTGSIGIIVPSANADATAILRDADAAMYRAKEAGRNQFALFDDDLRRRSVARLAIEVELRRALEHGEFELYFQPGVEPGSGGPFAAESLIRWNHPVRGIVAPLEFIPIAEASGLIRPIGRWVIEQAVSQLSAWDAMPGGPRLAVLSVNLSAVQLEDCETLDVVSRALDRYRIDPGRLCLEVTESVAMSSNPQSRLALEGFRRLGLRVAIDDFGTGYSSLAYLHELPVTTVKIDRTFVARLGGPDDSTPVVRAVVDMSHAMGLRVVAEGVSDEGLRDAVADLGCDLAQGFYWAHPMPSGEFVTWWAEAAARTLAVMPRDPRPAQQVHASV
jgi:diguanylate cyclase (GGDEF)-like protein/PAS domain S-box-containing protein